MCIFRCNIHNKSFRDDDPQKLRQARIHKLVAGGTGIVGFDQQLGEVCFLGGTKWNAVRFDDDDHYSDSKITFITANKAPAPIMQKLSEMYPDITMRHQWADDNVGYNCGERIYKAGEVVKEYLPDYGTHSVEYACKIMGTTPADHCLKLNEDGTEYVSFEPSEEISMGGM